MIDKMVIYSRLPVTLQQFACAVEGARIVRTRYAKGFHKKLAEYESRRVWSAEQLFEYRDKRMRGMVRHCYENVPYYRRLFNEIGVDPQSIRTLDDLSILPVLTKQKVNANPTDFVDAKRMKGAIKHHTSGTTGSGFIFYTTRKALKEQWACWWRFRQSIGIPFGQRQATIGTQRVVPINQTRGPFWRYNKPCNQTYFSSYHMRDEWLGSYYRELRDSRVEWIHGYPSILCVLASYMVRNGLALDGIKWVTTGAENLYEHQAELLKEAFGLVPYQHYGMCEGVANFSQSRDWAMRVDEDYAAVEFVENDGGLAEVVGSSLTNYVMPLLRWRVGDLAECVRDERGYRRIASLDGRSEDCVTLPNGTRIGKLDHVFKDTVGFAEAQIYQNEDYSLTLFVVKAREDTSEDETKAMSMLAESLNDSIPIRFEYVDRIPRSASGKLRFVVSEIDSHD